MGTVLHGSGPHDRVSGSQTALEALQIRACLNTHQIRVFIGSTYISGMRKREFDPCLPTRATTVPIGTDWIHEIKHDGYRLTVQREGKVVRLFTRNGHDWTKRYPLMVEAALRNRTGSFVLDGEAVLLGVDGVSDFDGLHSASTTMKSSFTPSTSSHWTARISLPCPCTSARTIWPGCWRDGRREFLSATSNRGRSARTCSAKPANLD
jgi:ATP dependent DNA ligase domain